MKVVKAWAHIDHETETIGTIGNGGVLNLAPPILKIFTNENDARLLSTSFVRVAEVEIREVKRRKR